MTPASDCVLAIHRRSGLGLRELARRAGTSHATIRAYETGAKEPRFDTLVRLAHAAGFELRVELVDPGDDAGAARDRPRSVTRRR